MASQYELQLKATLDTSDVQQKLQQLRQSQRQEGNNSYSSSTAGFNQAFAKIDTAIKSLQKSIDKLAASLARTSSPSFQASVNRAIAMQPARRASSSQSLQVPPWLAQYSANYSQPPMPQPIPWLKSVPYGRFRSQFYRALASNGRAEQMQIESDLHPGARFPAFNSIGYAHRAAMSGLAQQVLGPQFSTEAYRQLMQAYIGTRNDSLQLLARRNNTPSSSNNFAQSKKFGAIIGGQLLGGAAQYANDFGYTRTGAALNVAGQGVTAGSSAAYAASLFGASAKVAGGAGLAVGLAAATLEAAKAIRDLRDAAQQAARAQREVAKQQQQQGFQLQQGRFSFFDQQLARHVSKVQNTDIANERLNYARGKAEQAASKLEGMEDPATFEKRIRAQAQKMKTSKAARLAGWGVLEGEMQSMGYGGVIEMKGTDEAVDKAADKVIETYYKQFQLAGQQAQAAKATLSLWENVVENLKQAKERSEEALKNMRIEDANTKQTISDQAKQLESQFRMNDQVRSAQVYAMGILKDKTLSPQLQFDNLSSELDKVRVQLNQKLIEAYELNRKIATKPDMLASEYEDAAKRRDKLLSEADMFSSKAGVLEDALTKISAMALRPDLSHMTSLAQYGFNMGEKDDSKKAIEDYYSKMTSLTQQIRDKIDQGIKTTATYD